MTKVVRAAGGVVVDPTRKGRYLVVHRPRYDDWSFPKGKLRGGESHSEAARREVAEETGLVCDLLEELNPIQYVTPNRNLKTVRYWLMTPRSGSFKPNREVDVFTWVKKSQALALLTHDFDHAVLIDAHRRLKDLRKAEAAALRAAIRN